MVHKKTGQLDFADILFVNNKNLNQRLDKISQLIDWSIFEEQMKAIYSSRTGRPSHPLLILFKSLLLQTWYNLSDYAIEEALDDRLSFRRFTGLSASEKAPDHSVFSRFRDQLIEHDLHAKLFTELNRQLEKKGLIIKEGTLIDATVIEAAPKKPHQNKDGSAGKSSVDPDADWTKKGHKFLFGYKAHIGVDAGSELIRHAIMTPARTYDGEMLEQVVRGDEKWVFADKAYDSKKNQALLKEKNIGNGILINGPKNGKFVEVEKICNRILAKIRYPVERFFGTLKRTYRYSRARYLGLRKNGLHLTLHCFAYNLRKMEKLCA